MEYHNGQDLLGISGEHTLHELGPLVRGFYQHLRRLPLGIWAKLAEDPELDDAEHPFLLRADEHRSSSPDRRARARLRQIIDEMPGAAAQVRARVHGLVAVADGFVHPRAVARMRKVALTAALALVARPKLTEEEFGLLYRPFARAIPLNELAHG